MLHPPNDNLVDTKMSEQITFQKLRTFSSKVSKRNAFCKSTAYCLVTFKTFAQYFKNVR